MSFGDISNRFKQQAEATAEPERLPPDPLEVQLIRSRITGVLIRDARIAQGYSVEYLADVMQVSSDKIVSWEFGYESPSLPQLELLGYWLQVPVSHFMSSTETLVEQIAQRGIDQSEYFKIRDRMIGTQIRTLREEAGFTLAYLAEQVGIDAAALQAYEYGHASASLAVLTGLASVLRVNITAFLEGRDRVGTFLQAQELFDTFLKMKPEVREFVANPSNHAYLELAMKLAHLGTERLRGIAEDILEITL